MNLLNKWKIVSSDTLAEVIPPENIRSGALKGALKRLRQRGEIYSIRIGNPWIYFHPRFVKRWAALKQVDAPNRFRKFYTWGLDHHLKVVNVGRKLEERFPRLHIVANLGTEDSPINQGSIAYDGRKFVPDLILSDSILSDRKYTYVEVERTIKEKSRYRDRWFAYARDPNLECCVYWVFDRFHQSRLENEMQKQMAQNLIPSKFRMAILLDSDLEREVFDPVVTVFEERQKKQANLSEALFFKADAWTSHQLNPHQEFLKKQWEIKYSASSRGADHPLSSKTLTFEKCTNIERVVSSPRTEKDREGVSLC